MDRQSSAPALLTLQYYGSSQSGKRFKLLANVKEMAKLALFSGKSVASVIIFTFPTCNARLLIPGSL
jgi:hypothetical protein